LWLLIAVIVVHEYRRIRAEAGPAAPRDEAIAGYEV